MSGKTTKTMVWFKTDNYDVQILQLFCKNSSSWNTLLFHQGMHSLYQQAPLTLHFRRSCRETAQYFDLHLSVMKHSHQYVRAQWWSDLFQIKMKRMHTPISPIFLSLWEYPVSSRG